MNLDRLFSSARFFHDVSPLATRADGLLPPLLAHPYNWREFEVAEKLCSTSPIAPTLVPGVLKSLLSFLTIALIKLLPRVIQNSYSRHALA